MGQLGIGAMLHQLGGGSEHSASEYAGRTITALKLDDNRLKIDFSDGKKIEIWDNGQSCCESRYMVCDDDLEPFVGAQFVTAQIQNGPDLPDEYGSHECAFLIVETSNGSFTCSNHNEHNGYYGGFGMTITEPS